MSDGLQRRGRALEESFFNTVDQQLLTALREDAAAASQLDGLAAVSGIEDRDLLQQLADAGVQPETMAALSLFPLVQVAWADGKMDEKERQAVLSAAAEDGIVAATPAYQLLEEWLSTAPENELADNWHQFVGGLGEDLTPQAISTVQQQTLARARRVAEAAGGFLGLGNKVSSEEQAVLDALAAAFN